MGLDAHPRHSVLGYMNKNGDYLDDWRFRTTELELIEHVKRVEARRKILAIEEGPMAYWIAQTVRPYVSEVVICDPRENRAITSSPKKGDRFDTRQLCRLNRLGELKEVYHPTEDDRAIFKTAVQHYLDWRDQQVALKLKIKAKYRSWGVVPSGEEVYSTEGRGKWLLQLPSPEVRAQLLNFYKVLDMTLAAQRAALRQVTRLGRRYPEIIRFRQVPGVGPVGASLFSAYIQIPGRFTTKQQLWRYCRLGIRNRSSDGKPLGYEQLDRRGNGELKALSYRAWQNSCRGRRNLIWQFYQRSLAATKDEVHARLNTQRKILAALWGMWKTNSDFDPDQFLGTDQRHEDGVVS